MEDNFQLTDEVTTELKAVAPRRTRIMIGVNTLTSIDRCVYSNHCQIWFRLGRNFPEIDFILNNPNRMAIDSMRNMTAKLALSSECDYIIFIDDDVCVPIDFLTRMLKAVKDGADIVAGWTIIRGYPYQNMFFRAAGPGALTYYEDKDFPEDLANNDGILPVAAVGFSCVLIKCELLKKVEPPYFVTGPYNTEDVYFCLKATEAYPECKIVVDTNIKTSHNLGSEYIDPLNKLLYKKYVEELSPEILKQSPEIDTSKKEDTPEENETSYEEVLKAAVWNDKS